MKVKFKRLLILFALFAVSPAFAKVESVKGKLTSSGGLPLPGVNVIVKGTQNDSSIS